MAILLSIIGWFMAIVGLMIALLFPHLEGYKPSILSNVILWVVPIAGIGLILFSNKIVER